MADKKVERSGRERPFTPAQKLSSALSDPGTMSMADPSHDKGKSALVDKFRDREERWRREQALRDRQMAQPAQATPEQGADEGGTDKGAAAEPAAAGGGGGS
jgi:hypothetical protein